MSENISNKRLLQWILSKKDSLGIEIRHQEWAKSLGLYSYISIMKFKGTQYAGFGSDSRKELALIKSFAELVERVSLSSATHIHNSNGVAAHTDPQIAKISAAFELIERDLFLCHFYSRKAFKKYAISNEDKQTISLKNYLADRGIRLEVGIAADFCKVYAVICCGFLAQGGCLIGSSASYSLQSALHKSLLELVRSCSDLNRLKPLSFDDFAKLENIRPIHHKRLGLHPEASALMEEMFSNHASLSQLATPEIESFTFEEVPLDPIFLGCGLSVFRASNIYLQELYFGRETIINLERLQRFMKDQSLQGLEIRPHIFY